MKNSDESKVNRELLARGWEETCVKIERQGFQIPQVIHFRIEGKRNMRALRGATLEELDMAIAALDADISSVSTGRRPENFDPRPIEEFRGNMGALLAIREQTSRAFPRGAVMVIEALFPHIPVKKRSEEDKVEREKWLASRKEAGCKIDPDTAVLEWTYGLELDPYGAYDEWELPEEFQVCGRVYFAHAVDFR